MPGPQGGASAAATVLANAKEAALSAAEALQAALNRNAQSISPEVVTALPTANAGQVGRVLMVPGTASTADVLSICLKSATNTYSWKAVATG